MELEILKHSIINLVGNIVIYFLVAIMISWIISACFNIKNDVMPFGWVTKLFSAAKVKFWYSATARTYCNCVMVIKENLNGKVTKPSE